MKELERILKVLADKNRMRIIKLLERKKLCVCEIAFVLGIKQPSASRHLKKLKEAGILKEEQESFWTNYLLKSSHDNHVLRSLLSSAKTWLTNDPQITKDLKKLRQANRNNLCCR